MRKEEERTGFTCAFSRRQNLLTVMFGVERLLQGHEIEFFSFEEVFKVFMTNEGDFDLFINWEYIFFFFLY